MLTHLYIKNFVIIDQLDLEFHAGFTVLTGETGAGKSIIIDALDLGLGTRAEQTVIRQGAERCEITLTFFVAKIPAAKSWLKENDLLNDDECIIRRTISNDGRSRSTINGTQCPLQQIRELGNLLINIHGQHEHQALLKRDQQRELLDNFGRHTTLCEQTTAIYQSWRNTQQELEQLLDPKLDQQSKQELLRYQISELDELNLSEDETTQLEQEQKLLSQAEQLVAQCQTALNLIADADDNNALHFLHEAARQLYGSQDLHPKIHAATKLLNEALIQAQEAETELRHYVDHFEFDPKRLQAVETRLSQIYQLSRKHKIQPKAFNNHLAQLKAQLADLEHVDVRIEKLQQTLIQLKSDYNAIANKLSDSRTQTGAKLEKAVTQLMQKLGMAGGKFKINFEALKSDELTSFGAERVEFLVSANPGQTPQPLNKVASGGELSRISLAIQVIAAQKDQSPTLIFDEVDVGIGGGVAEIVGRMLHQLGQQAQVLCITHLPQVAACGKHHWRVEKQVQKNLTTTQINLLNAKDRVEEIARMLGGIKITAQTLAHAKEMLQQPEGSVV